MARNYLRNGPVKSNIESDIEATKTAIRNATDAAKYSLWLKNLFGGIEKSKGIYNRQDIFTASGNRRSFAATHWSVTLENIVKAMKLGTIKGGSMFAANGIFGQATKNYKSIDEIRADASRLGTVDEAAYEAQQQEYMERFSIIAMSIMRKSESNQFIALDDAMEALCEAVRRGKTQAGLARVLKEYSHLNVKADTASQMYELVKEMSEMPTEYFEAKPERAVGLDEIRLVVIPAGKYGDIKEQLRHQEIAYVEYEPTVEGDRIKALNGEAARGLLFSRRDNGDLRLVSDKDGAQAYEYKTKAGSAAAIVSDKGSVESIGATDDDTRLAALLALARVYDGITVQADNADDSALYSTVGVALTEELFGDPNVYHIDVPFERAVRREKKPFASPLVVGKHSGGAVIRDLSEGRVEALEHKAEALHDKNYELEKQYAADRKRAEHFKRQQELSRGHEYAPQAINKIIWNPQTRL